MKNPGDTLVATGGSPVARPPGDSRAGRPYGTVAGCFLLCSLFGLAGCGKPADKAGDKDEPSPVPVRVARAEERTLRPSFVVIGTVVADPKHVATLTSAVPGLVTRLAVAEGSRVDKGDLVIQLDEQKARYDLDRAKAA